MIKEFLISFSDNFKEKTRNPFLGTYVLIWIIRNWELVYSIFNFDNSYKLAEKVEFIKSYYSANNFQEGILWNLGWTFLVLIITYLVLNMSRVIINISEKQLKPWVYKKTDSKSIVLKSVHEQVRNDRDNLQLRLDQERESKSKLEIRIKNLEEEIIETSRQKNKEGGEQNIVLQDNVSDEIERLYEKLKKGKILDFFINIGVRLNKNEFIEKGDSRIDNLIELGLISHKEENYSGLSDLYNLTEDGQKVLRLARFKE